MQPLCHRWDRDSLRMGEMEDAAENVYLSGRESLPYQAQQDKLLFFSRKLATEGMIITILPLLTIRQIN